MKLALYLAASFLLAILSMAFAARGPDEMIANAVIIWFMPAFVAFASRNKETAIGRYGFPVAAQILLTLIMLNGMRAP